MMNTQDLRDFKITDLSGTKKHLEIQKSSLRTHSIECATVYYYNNLEWTSDPDELMRSASSTFQVPLDTLKFVLGP